MNYISHIKELVSGIIDNETVTRDTEAYNALTALKNHLESLEEVYKYMPYKDPGPVIQKLEQSLARANTRNQELRKQALYLNEEIEQKTKSRDQCYKYWQEYKSKYETLDQKNQDLKKKFQDLNEENAHYRDLLDQEDQANKEQFQSQIEDLNKEIEQKNTYIEELRAERKDLENNVNTLENQVQEQTQTLDQKQDEINFLKGFLSEDQLEEYQEYLIPDDQLPPDDQPPHGPKRITRSWKQPKSGR